METLERNEWADVAQLVEITSDAVIICELDGTILHVNNRLLDLMCEERADVINGDVKDVLYSSAFERATEHRLPFETDGSESELMLKLSDGSFIPVLVRAGSVTPPRIFGRRAPRVLVALHSIEEQYSHDRQLKRALSELRVANKRLSGTLSVIMSTVGSDELPSLLDTVLNQLVGTLDASGAAIYFSESGGFKLRGVSKELEDSYLPEFMPYGAGIPTYVLRESRACRLSIQQDLEGDRVASGMFMDLDNRSKHLLRVQDMPPYRSEICLPVFYGTQVLGVLEVGWKRPQAPLAYDVNVLEVICDYLSIQLVGMASSLRSRRTAELGRSLNVLRDELFTYLDDPVAASHAVSSEICAVLNCHFCPVEYDAGLECFVIDFEGGSRVALPGDPESLFFSTTAPAARLGAASDGFEVSVLGGASADDLKHVRLTRVDESMPMGGWLRAHGLPCQGIYVDSGIEAGHYRSDADSRRSNDAIVPADVAKGPTTRALLLRDGSQEPIDDLEYDYLVHLAHDFELIYEGESQKREERHIAQTLQIGMRNSLGDVPGIATDSVYLSATNSALVGGDFYTLIRLPDDCAVMILGDVSGKGIEAASMSALVKTALTAYAWEGAGPARMARSLNSMLMGFSRVETFVTAFIAKIDLKAGRATYCSAGHPPTMVIRPESMPLGGGEPRGGEVELLGCQSGVIGAFEGMVYETGAFTFAPGDMLFMYTDGTIEARDRTGAFFGEQRLRDLLLSVSAEGVSGICGKVLGELDRFTDSALDDDIALVSLEFLRGRS